MEEIIEDLRNYEKWVILTVSEYFDFNNKLSLAKGYNLSNPTERVYPMQPSYCKINIQVVNEIETYDLACAVCINGSTQDLFPELLTEMNFINKSEIQFVDVTTNEIEADGLKADQIDWSLNHIAATSINSKFIKLESEPRTIESDEAVSKLINGGLIIKTIVTREQ